MICFIFQTFHIAVLTSQSQTSSPSTVDGTTFLHTLLFITFLKKQESTYCKTMITRNTQKLRRFGICTRHSRNDDGFLDIQSANLEVNSTSVMKKKFKSKAPCLQTAHKVLHTHGRSPLHMKEMLFEERSMGCRFGIVIKPWIADASTRG